MRNKIFLTIAALSCMTTACNTEHEQPLEWGELSVSLYGEPDVEVLTKTPVDLEQDDPAAADYMVRIYDSSDDLKYEASYSTFEAQKLPLGNYYVTAENCTEAAAEEGNGKMRLYGRSADVNLTADALSQTASVSCVVTNAKVSVMFDESVGGRFTDLKVTLTGGTTRTENIVIEETAVGVVTETWFNPSELTYTITGTFTGSGMNKPVNITKTIDLDAKDNVLLNVKVNLQNGQLMPSVTIDTKIDDPTEIPEEFNPYI